MKIAYFTDIFFPQINGVTISLATIASALGSLNHHVTIYAPKPKHGKLSWKAKGVSLVFLQSIPSFLYPDFRAATPVSPKLFYQITKLNPDVLHFQTTFLLGGGSILLGKVLRKPIVGSFHGYFMEPEYLKIKKINRQVDMIGNILWKYAAFFFNQCDAILTYSDGAKKDLQSHGVKKPIFVIPNSINEKKIKKVDNETVNNLKQKYNTQNGKVFLYVGRLSAEKSVEVLIRSFALVLKKFPNVHLVLIGEGPMKTDLQKLCKELGIENAVVFTGGIDQDELLSAGYFQMADAFVTASTSELQPVSIIEAMYFGLPLIGIAKRGVGEMIKGVGLLSPPDKNDELASSMLELLNDNKLHQKLSKNSYSTYKKKYVLENITKEYEKLYDNVIANYDKTQLITNIKKELISRYKGL